MVSKALKATKTTPLHPNETFFKSKGRGHFGGAQKHSSFFKPTKEVEHNIEDKQSNQKLLPVEQQEIGTTLQRQIAQPPGGPDSCFNLLQEIIALLEEVAQRINDALDDRHNLYRYHREIRNAHPEHGSWEGHRRRFNHDRERLRQKLAEWESNDTCRGFPLTAEQRNELTEAEEFKDREFPVQPAPTAQRVAEQPFSRERISEVLIEVGVPAFAVGGLVVLIIAALADPEPVTKVGLLIGSTAAVLFFAILGRDSGNRPQA